jgi:hypothetical protein
VDGQAGILSQADGTADHDRGVDDTFDLSGYVTTPVTDSAKTVAYAVHPYIFKPSPDACKQRCRGQHLPVDELGYRRRKLGRSEGFVQQPPGRVVRKRLKHVELVPRHEQNRRSTSRAKRPVHLRTIHPWHDCVEHKQIERRSLRPDAQKRLLAILNRDNVMTSHHQKVVGDPAHRRIVFGQQHAQARARA